MDEGRIFDRDSGIDQHGRHAIESIDQHHERVEAQHAAAQALAVSDPDVMKLMLAEALMEATDGDLLWHDDPMPEGLNRELMKRTGQAFDLSGCELVADVYERLGL